MVAFYIMLPGAGILQNVESCQG